MEHEVNELVFFLLMGNKNGYPVKRQDIIKKVFKGNAKTVNVAIDKAAQILQQVFGLKLVDIGSKVYILVNSLDSDPEDPHLTWPPKDNAQMALVMIVLSIIYMNDGIIDRDDLFHALKKLGLDPNAKHSLFGDVTKMLTQELPRQGYLEYIKQQSADNAKGDFKWGPRATQEITKMSVLEFVSQIYNVEPQTWPRQFTEASESTAATSNGV